MWWSGAVIGFLLWSFWTREDYLPVLYLAETARASIDYFAPRRGNQAELQVVDRYLYLTTLGIGAHVLACLIRLIRPTLMAICLILSMNEVSNWIRQRKEYQIYQRWIYQQWKNGGEYVLYSIVAGGINFLCSVCLEMDSLVSWTEAQHLFLGGTFDHVKIFVQTFVFANIAETLGSKRAGIYGMMKLAFNSGQVLEDGLICRYSDIAKHCEEPVEKLRFMIRTRQFVQIFNPDIQIQFVRLFNQKSTTDPWVAIWRIWDSLLEMALRISHLHIWTSLTSNRWEQLGLQLVASLNPVGCLGTYLTGSPFLGCLIGETQLYWQRPLIQVVQRITWQAKIHLVHLVEVRPEFWLELLWLLAVLVGQRSFLVGLILGLLHPQKWAAGIFLGLIYCPGQTNWEQLKLTLLWLSFLLAQYLPSTLHLLTSTDLINSYIHLSPAPEEKEPTTIITAAPHMIDSYYLSPLPSSEEMDLDTPVYYRPQ